MLDGRFSRITSYADTRQDTGEITGGNMNEWINIKDKLPQPEKDVLCYIDGGFDVCFLSSNPSYGWRGGDDYFNVPVEYWMSLPEPPESSNTDFNLTQPAVSQVKS